MTKKSLFIVLEDVQSGSPLHPAITYPVFSGRVSIGRHPDGDIVLPDGSVSGRHVELHTGGGGVVVRNLSENGATFVAGEPLESGETRTVQSQSFWLQVGRALLEVTVLEQTLPVSDVMVPPLRRLAQPVLEPTAEPVLSVNRGPAPEVWVGGARSPLFPTAARVLVRLCESAPGVVERSELAAAMTSRDSAVGGGNLDQNITYIRNMFVSVLESAPEAPALLAAMVRSGAAVTHGNSEPDARQVARQLVKNVRGVGYQLLLPADVIEFRGS